MEGLQQLARQAFRKGQLQRFVSQNPDNGREVIRIAAYASKPISSQTMQVQEDGLLHYLSQSFVADDGELPEATLQLVRIGRNDNEDMMLAEQTFYGDSRLFLRRSVYSIFLESRLLLVPSIQD
jgi:hypothetical protein